MNALTPTTALIDALGLDLLPLNEQEELLLDIQDLIFKDSVLRMLETMDDQTKDAFSRLLETDPSDAEIEAFLTERVPGAEQAVTGAIKDLEDDILAVTGESQD